jgi:hypothetical protein
MDLLSQASADKVTHAGLFFVLAAWIHARQVKKEIKSQMGSVVDSINHLGETFKKVEVRIEMVESKVDKIDSRLQAVENPNRGIQ